MSQELLMFNKNDETCYLVFRLTCVLPLTENCVQPLNFLQFSSIILGKTQERSNMPVPPTALQMYVCQ